MTPLKLSRSQLSHLERNLQGKVKRVHKPKKDFQVTIHVARDVKPETLNALVALARRVLEMSEMELEELIRKVKER